MMNRVNVNIYPPDGRCFVEADGVRIRGDSWKQVIERVTAYRTRNGRPVGDVVNEIEDQVCRRNPSLCGAAGPAMPAKTPNTPKVEPIKVRVLKWLSSMVKTRQAQGGLKLVKHEVATERAKTCARCPFNSELPAGCSSCRTAMTSMRIDVLGTNAPEVDTRIVGCSVLGAHLPTAVWLDEIVVEHPGLPAHCWRKRSI